MEIFFIILRSVLASLGLIVAIVYILSKCWSKIPTPKITYNLIDAVIYVVVSVLCGLGFNSSWALLAFLPLLFMKGFCHFFIQKKRVRGSGRWVELEWRMYSGLNEHISRANPTMFKEMSRIPKQTHILIPRFVFLIGLKIFEKQLDRNKPMLSKQLVSNPYLPKMQNDMEQFIKRSKSLEVGSAQELSFQALAKLKVIRL